MKPPPFDYAKPASLSEALELLASDEDAKILAGGQSFMPVLNFRLASPSLLIDINGLAELGRISLVDGGLRLGAIVRYRDLEDSDLVAAENPLLAHALHHIAHYQIRNRGTVGGSSSHADPSAEFPAVSTLCGAEYLLQSTRGSRVLTADEFFQGALTTALEADEILTEIRFPPWPKGRRWAFEEIAPRLGDFAILGAAVLLDPGETRILVFGAGDRATRLSKAEAALKGRTLDGAAIREAAKIAREEIDPQTDIHATAEYRKAMAEVLVERCLERASGVKVAA